MTDQSRILDEAETLDLLRAGRSGDEPPLTDITPLALRGGLRLRRRRQAGQFGAGALLAGVAAFALVVATPGLSPTGEVQTADSAPDSAALSAQEARLANHRVLAKALGPDFEVVDPGAGSGTSPFITPKAGSAAERALPTGWAAQADVIVETGVQELRCEPDADRADGTTTCTPRTLSDGRQVVLEARGGALKPDTRAEIRRVHFLQPDGDAIAVSLYVRPDSATANDARVPRDAINAWLDPYDDALIAAATDPEMALGSVAAREPAVATDGPDDTAAHAQSLQVLQAHLGRDFQRSNPNAEAPVHDSLVWNSGSTAAKALPEDYGARAHVSVFADPEDNICDPTATPDRAGESCKIRPLPGGAQVILRGVSSPLEASVPVEIRHVYFTQPDGDVVDVSLAVIPETLDGVVPRQAIGAWLKTFEIALIAAATDPEMAPGTVAEREQLQQGRAALPNNAYLREILGSDWSLLDEHDGPGLFVGPGIALELAADRVRGTLPDGSTGGASVHVYPHEGPVAQLCPVGPGINCTTRDLPDGRQVLVSSEPVSYGSGSANGTLIVFFLRPNQEVVVVGLTAVTPLPAESDQEETARQVSDWIESYRDKVIAAATDSRMHQ